MTIQDPDDNNGMPQGDKPATGIIPAELQQKAQTEFGEVSDAVRENLDTVRQHAAEDIGNLKQEAKSQIGSATDKAKGFAGEQKDMAATQLSGIAAAINKVAEELSRTDQGAVAGYARDLAGGVTKFADTVHDKDVDDLMGMAQDFGRRQPVAFLGAAALAGFVASRFALASAHRRDNGDSSDINGGGNGRQ
jgi:F0F1-type ATP synthase membrane subunit b/b'